jgi:ATP adenylyltransferase
MGDFPRGEVEALWAPWRVEYYSREHADPRDFLVCAASAGRDADHLVVARRPGAFLIMNKYPYAVGHLMAVPCRKVADIGGLEPGEVLELWSLCGLAQRVLTECVRAQGFNMGVNLGKVGGAGFAEHLHLHVVPRWPGDYNFMPVVAGTRILPAALQPLYERLVDCVRRLEPLSAPRA